MQLVPMPGTAAAHAWHQQLPRGDGSLPGISLASWQHPGVLLPAPLGTASMGVWCPGDCTHPVTLFPCAVQTPWQGGGAWGGFELSCSERFSTLILCPQDSASVRQALGKGLHWKGAV